MTDSTSLEQLQSQLLANNESVLANPLQQVLEPLMPLLSLALTVGAALSVIFVIYMIINIIQKQRQHAAIMRIDRNLQKLVDSQSKPAPTQKPAVTPLPVSEQNEAV